MKKYTSDTMENIKPKVQKDLDNGRLKKQEMIKYILTGKFGKITGQTQVDWLLEE